MFTLFTEQPQAAFGDKGISALIVWLALLNISMHFVWVSIGELLAKTPSSLYMKKALICFMQLA